MGWSRILRVSRIATYDRSPHLFRFSASMSTQPLPFRPSILRTLTLAAACSLGRKTAGARARRGDRWLVSPRIFVCEIPSQTPSCLRLT